MKRLNNNAFSLVELIIVIAMMAALVGVLAPQYMKYVSKAERSRDCAMINVILDACETMALDPNTSWRSGTSDAITIIISDTGATYTNGATAELAMYVPPNDVRLKSTDWGPFTIVATRLNNGRVTFVIDDDDRIQLNKYSSAVAERFE